MKKTLLALATTMLLGSFAAQAQTYPDLYVRGVINGWGTPSASEKFTCDQNTGVYTLTLPSLAGSFKIAAVSGVSGWDDNYNYGGESPLTVELDKDYTLVNGGQSNDLKPGGNWSNVTLTFNINTMNLRVTGASAPSTVAWELHGQFVDEAWSSTAMTESNGVWTCTVTPTVAEGNFGMREMTNGAQTAWCANTTATLSETNPEITMDATGGDTKYSLTAGKDYTFTWNPETKALKVSTNGVNPPVGPTAPAKVYLMANIPESIYEWTPGTQIEMNKVGDNVWSVTQEIAASFEGNGWFGFVTNDATSWDGDENTPGINSTDRYGAPADNTPVVLGQGMTVKLYAAEVNASAAASWKIPAGNYNFKFDYNNMTMTVTNGSGIVVLDTENGAAQWFTLQGVRVENPAEGQVYIRVVNGKAAKVLF